MTTTYIPSCPACRTQDPLTFYKACGGCQARRAVHMAAYHSDPKGKLPAPSRNQPKKATQ